MKLNKHFVKSLLIIWISLFVFNHSISAQKNSENKKKDALNKDVSKSVPYQWNLDHIYTDETTWKKDFEKLKSYQGMMNSYKDNLTLSATRLLDGLKFRDKVNLLAHQLEFWAEKRVQKNINDTTRQDLVNQISRLYESLSAEQAFIDAALVLLEPDLINNYITQEPDLVAYKPYIDNLIRTRSNQLNPDAAFLIAQAGDILGFSQSMFKAIKQDLKFAPVKDEKGNLLPLSGNYVRLMESENSVVRSDAYTSRMNGYFEHKNALAMALASEVNRDIFLARAQGFSSCLEWALMEESVPKDVFTNFLAAVNKNVPSLQKWLNIRRKILGLDSLTLADDYLPVQIPNSNPEHYGYDESVQLAINALAPLGDNYISQFENAQNQGWIDVYPSPEKDSWYGSASMAIGVHPYVLLNWDSTLFSLKTLVHEMGHAISMNYMAQDEPFLYQRWWYCTSEVPSTCNEILLKEYMIANAQDKIQKLVLLGDEIERTAHLMFNLALESEFELAVHLQAENGETLSVEWLLSTYQLLAKKYYGSAISLSPLDGMKGILDLLNNPWGKCYARYVYSVGYCASQNIAKRLITKEPGIQNTYRRFIGRGRAHYPIDAMKEAGVDFTTSAPYEETLKDFADKVDQFERLFNQL